MLNLSIKKLFCTNIRLKWREGNKNFSSLEENFENSLNKGVPLRGYARTPVGGNVSAIHLLFIQEFMKF
jgi:hypothetical protein